MSFRLKTIAGVSTIVAVVLAVLLALGFGYLRRSVESQFDRRSQSALRTFVQAARDPLVASDLGTLDGLAREIVSDAGVINARVFDAQDRVVAQAGKAGATGTIDRVVAADVQHAGTRFGRIELQLSAADLRDELAQAQRAGLLLALGGTLLAALAAGLLGRYLTRPLADLSTGSAQLAAGELGVQVPVRGRDELGAAAEAFNRMSARLRESYAELDRRAGDLRLILENIVDGVITLDERARILDASPAAARIFGRDADRLRGMSLQALFDAEPAGAVAAMLARLRDGPSSEPIQVPVQRADGANRVLDLQFSRIESAGQAPRAPDGPVALAVVRDSTARLEAQRALAQREAQLREVLNATHDGIIVTDERGRIESFNRGAEAQFGWQSDEVVGRDLSVILPTKHRAQHGGYMARYVSGSESSIIGREREFEAVRKDGQPLWIALRVAELQVDGRRHFLGVVHDITERRRTMQELRDAKEAAEQAAEAKSDFLANMSHEIRTPMHGVLGSLEMMRDTPLNTQQQRHLDTATQSAVLLLGVIDEILDFSRLEAGKLRIESIDFDLHRTVEDVTAMLSSRAHGKRLELVCYLAPELPQTVRGDPIRLRQVLVNLCGNAIKFTERGEVMLSVNQVRDAQGRVQLHFEVRDTGIGIPSEKQGRLFEPFTQADSSTSRRFGGSGLGLSICRRLVGLMGGSIGFTSIEGKGSTFWFTLPLAGQALAARSPHSGNLTGTRVLLVDDNATNRIIVHRYLSAWGADSSSAASGEEGLAKLQDAAAAGRPYHVALLDLNMPGMDGYELVARVQSDPALAGMPLIMLSSSVQDAARLDGRRVDVWLDKPVRQSDLHDAITTVLNDRAPPAAPTAAPTAPPQFSGERVLLVEDNPVTSDVGSQMLRKRGFHVTLAANGLAAVEAVRRSVFDIVLMDVQMPTMDGYEATREIRAWEAASQRRRVPIVALTAHAMPADRGKCLAAGMDDYVVKPYSSETLTTVVARWLRHFDPAAGPAAAEPAAAGPTAVPTLDEARMNEVRAVMGDDLNSLLAKVCDSLESQLADMDAACGKGNLAAAREAAHRMKNTAGDVGATGLHGASAEIERRLASGATEVPSLAALKERVAETVKALRTAIDGPQGQA